MTGERAPTYAIRWTERAYLLTVAGSLLVVIAIAVRSPVPLFVALPLLVAPLASASLAMRKPPRADLVWEAGGLGASLEVEGTLRGTFGTDASNLVVGLTPPSGTRAEGPLRAERGPNSVRFAVSWRLPEPTITTLAPPRVVWRDPLGLCEQPVGGLRPALTLGRYPADLHRLGSLRLDRTVALPGETRSRRLGRSGEFHGIRKAAPDEPWNRINWRASARVGRLLANEFQVDLTGDLILLLDERPRSKDTAFDERLLAIERAAVYGMAEALFRTKVRVGYASFGEFLDAVPLSTGRGHRARVLRAIATGRLSTVAGPAERCAYALRRFYRPGVTTLVVSGWDGEPSGGLVPYLRRQGFPPLLVSPSPLPLQERWTETPGPDELLERRLKRLERRAQLAETWGYAPVVDWDDYWSLEGLVRILRRPTHQRVS